MKSVCVIGHFGFGKELLNGQTIKTKIVTNELKKQLGQNNISTIDIAGGKKRLLSLFFTVIKTLKGNKNIVMMPVENGLMFFAPVLCFLNIFFNRALHYVVVGGWLPEFLSKKRWLRNMLKLFKCIYVETNIMKVSLERLGLLNIYVMPNCKELNIFDKEELIYHETEPFPLCIFSRVMKEKGIEDAIEAVKRVNTNYGRKVFLLDIYGEIDENYKEIFSKLEREFPPYIKYKGYVNYGESSNVLKKYYGLLFPTYYEGEGFAGTLIDALAAGIPVVASNWKYNSEIVIEGKTGYLHEFCNVDDLIKVLDKVYMDKQKWNSMKEFCTDEAKKYLPSVVITNLIKFLD